MSSGRFFSCLLLVVILVIELTHVKVNGLRSNRTRRQSRTKATSTGAILMWQSIYVMSVKMSKAFGNNALLANMNDMITTEIGQTSKAYCGGGGGGYRGGYGGYSYSQPPIVYYVQEQQPVYFDTGITDFTSGFGDVVSNNALIEQLIALIQTAIDDSYTYYYQSDTTAKK